MADHILSEIWIYPVKALAGARVTQAQVTEKGFRYDRRWMLVNEHNKFMTQREEPRLALFKVQLQPEGFLIHFDGEERRIPFELNEGAELKAVLWKDVVKVIESSDSMGRWFSDHLGYTCRLVHFPESNPRRIDPHFVAEERNVSLADGYPFLIIGQSSLDELNKRLQDPLPMNRFRPSLVFTGGEPNEEDRWRNFTIGKIQFQGVKTCARCPVPTIDQETGIRGKEPLTTLATYRKVDGKVKFGMNLIAHDTGELKEGEGIRIERLI